MFFLYLLCKNKNKFGFDFSFRSVHEIQLPCRSGNLFTVHLLSLYKHDTRLCSLQLNWREEFVELLSGRSL
jgi:hypothetical protein